MGGAAPLSPPGDRGAITGLVLAGGRATRMDGGDKGLLPFLGEPLALRAAHRLASQTGAVAVNANRHLESYAAWGWPVWPDVRDDRPGPLAGVLAGLQRCETAWLATVPCDSPCFPLDLVARLVEGVGRRTGALAAVAATPSPGGPALQPVFALLHRSLTPSLEAFLESGERKVERWLRSLPLAAVVFDDPAAFANVNTPQELAALEASSFPPR